MEDITIKTQLKTALNPGLSGIEGKGGAQKPGEAGPSFGETLAKSIAEVNHLQKEADQAIEKLASGESQNVHGTMLAVNKADMAFRMTMQVKNKIVEAYQEVMRMQI
ncbi:MAG: flagellar hook-basal body complex protein FliE [Nitrospinaceae bacterium]|nr:flagellar hook-basal body complex protein FliE [Nitrospinaceae bacterium]NIR54941.1 flagellar hook-basal body complex protein FliE [Nitrospinaceae bacterium]NIT82183.1 flagellar hook-basal body complex protein FliE [Nitrospinaceae bacterium]NIX34570.1 flagellar hook-basal body complex protein FliE [Nitrospinaceae bacterium]NIY15396.1 flagellar hook-basal body complex protein FliE [Nitrospinaceae bacterium]